jgi:hypothetical protein
MDYVNNMIALIVFILSISCITVVLTLGATYLCMKCFNKKIITEDTIDVRINMDFKP